MIKDHKFWVGAIVGYALVVIFPQLNIRTKLRG